VSGQAPAPPPSGDELLRVAEAVHAGEVSVAFRPGPTVLAKLGDKLLDIAEASRVPMESGCRMGMCGSDPVRIVEGEENLSAMRSAERRTLERLDLGPGCRMACVSRVQGPVVVDPQPSVEPRAEAADDEEGRPVVATVDHALERTIRRVVVIGAGVAAVTAAGEIRGALAEAELALIGDEPYAFYNRMAITRLVSESVSIESLYLNRRDWAESRRIDHRRGVAVTGVDRASREVELADGERLPYDRVVIATYGRSFRRSRASERMAVSSSVRSTTPSKSSSTFGGAGAGRRSSSAAVCSASKPRTTWRSSTYASSSSTVARGR
jgi:nitrite reductase (NADH) large subunit